MDSVPQLASDCEAISVVGLAQEVNAWTSISYGIFGALLALAAIRGRLTRAAMLLGALVIAESVGSFLYHGRPTDPSKWLHDVALVGMLATIAGWHVGRMFNRADSGAWIGGISVTLAAALLHPLIPEAVNGAVVAIIAVILIAEVAARRRGQPAAFGWGLGLVVATGISVYLLGRTDGPLCEPASLIQLHGLWHVLSAFAVFVWAERALAPAGPGVGSGLIRGLSDRVVGLVSVGVVRAFHRTVDVSGGEFVPRDRPVVLVANHGNGFVDPVVVAAAIWRLPRFIAKAALWKVPPARLALDALAVLPVYRSSDGDDPHGNDRTFAATNRALARGETVAIFPEGTTGDRAGLDRVRSGAARIALGAQQAGVERVTVVPVGLAFESRVRTRSRASVTFGPGIDLDQWCREDSRSSGAEPDRPDLDRPDLDRPDLDRPDLDRVVTAALTEEIRGRLTAVSPVYADVDQREQLRLAAAVALRANDARGAAPTFGEVERQAARLAAAPATLRHAVVDALAGHALRREMVGVGDADLASGPLRRGGARLAAAIAALVFFGPILATAALIHLPTVILVQLAVASVGATATKGTVRLLVGLVTAALTWWIAAMVITDGALNVTLVMLTLAALGTAALATWTWVIDGLTILRLWFRARDRRQLLPGLVMTRDQVVAAVNSALEADPDPVPLGESEVLSSATA